MLFRSRNSIDSVQFVNQTNSNSLIKNDSNGIIGPQDSVTNKNKAVLQEADVSTLKPESTDNNSFKRQVFTIRESNTYSDRNPIPMNAPFPDGIVYTVQVGAFKNPIPNSLFKGVSPVNGTKTESGFIRYQAGIFNELKEANTAKNQLRDMGFRDAFVVAYKNNQRISLSEIGNGSAISRSSNTQSVNPGTTDSVRQGANTLQSVVADTVAVKEVTSVGGLFFTVQIGIFGSTLNSIQSKNLEPITRYALGNGTYRYSAGVYNELERVKADRAKVQQLGISDAFIAAYFNGERIKIGRAHV